MPFTQRKFIFVILLLLLLQTWWVIMSMVSYPNSWQIDAGRITTDVGRYYSKVKPVLEGTLAFDRMPLEYPIAAFPIMAWPALIASNMDQYLALFVLEIMIWNAILFFMVVLWTRREHSELFAVQSATWYTLWMLLFTPMWAFRIDIPAATLIFASFIWLVSRPGLAAVIGVLGGYMKLVPLVMVAAAIRQRRSIKVPLVAAGTFLFILAMWWVAAQPSMEYAIRYHLQREIEIGSLYSGILFVIGKIAHWTMFVDLRFASLELLTPVPQKFLKLIPIGQAAAVLYPLWRLKTGTHARNLRLVTAMVLGYIIFGKVLSPQYMLWLIPLYAVVAGPRARKQRLIFTMACLATTILYPLGFLSLAQLSPAMFVVLNVRNGFLLWLYWIAIRPEKLDPRGQASNSPAHQERPS